VSKQKDPTTTPNSSEFDASLWAGAMARWWRDPERIVIVAVRSPEDLPNPFDPDLQHMFHQPDLPPGTCIEFSQSSHTGTALCRFKQNASEQEIADQQKEMLRLLRRGQAVWAAYWADSEDQEFIWVVGVPGREGSLFTLYAHIRAEIARKARPARRQIRGYEDGRSRKEKPTIIAPTERRAKFVEKVLKVARRDSAVRQWIANIQDRRDTVGFACEIAAIHFRVRPATIQTDWSHRRKPRKKA